LWGKWRQNSFTEYDEYIVPENLEAILKIGGFVFMIGFCSTYVDAYLPEGEVFSLLDFRRRCRRDGKGGETFERRLLK